ncbi:MAG: phytanoyl-CoA dioxygenase family protein [Candidatus Puniceispirillales bacterium]
MPSLPELDEATVEAFDRDGVVFLPGLFRDWVEVIAEGIEENMASPGPYAAENTKDGDTGRFFDDYCNWQRIAAIEKVMRHSPAAAAAAQLMRSSSAQIFHDHVLVKEPGTAKPTPWHQDAPYYFVDGMQNVSFWIPVDPVEEATLRTIAGSHRWDKMVLPVRWLNEDAFYPDEEDYLPVPDPDRDPDDYEIREWSMQPGDAVAFHFRAVHGARGNMQAARRRALSLRYVGDDARYVTRPGRTSPPFPGHQMEDGERLREDWFPVISL